jgi:H+/Cl- antiporter ClcA
MNNKFSEETVLFASVLKWGGLATIVGIIVGCSTAVFIKLLNLSTAGVTAFQYHLAILPLSFLLTVLIVKKLAPEAEGHGTDKVIEAVHERSGRIDHGVVPVKLFATILTIATGGSAGKEGPAAQIGAALTSIFASIFRFDDDDRRKLVICGISAGFASVFGTPMAGAIFGVEVLFAGSILYDVLFPSFISGIMAYQVAMRLGVGYIYGQTISATFDAIFFLKVVGAGIFFGVCSFLFIESMNLGKKMSKAIRCNYLIKAAAAGVVLSFIGIIFHERHLGLGVGLINTALQGESVNWFDPVMKIIATSVTLSFGGSGGIVTPIFYTGATAGSVFAGMFGLDHSTFSAIGLVAVLAGCANTPIAASIMSVELFGPAIGPFAAVACIVSFLITGHRSVYPSQILSLRKSDSIDVNVGNEMDELKIKTNFDGLDGYKKIIMLKKHHKKDKSK